MLFCGAELSFSVSGWLGAKQLVIVLNFRIGPTTQRRSACFRIEMMTWLTFYGIVLLFMRGCARNRSHRAER